MLVYVLVVSLWSSEKKKVLRSGNFPLNLKTAEIKPEFEWHYRKFKEGLKVKKKVLEHHQTVDCTLKGHCLVCGLLFGVLLESWMRYLRQSLNTQLNYGLHVNKKSKNKWHTQTPTHGLASTLRMRTAISPGQWQPWTAVSALLGIEHRAFSPIFCLTAMPCWWGLTRLKQLPMAATAWLIWLCACVSYRPDCGLVFECLTFLLFFFMLIPTWVLWSKFYPLIF